MPAKVKVRIVAGRDLPVMDRASDLTDAFVEVKFASTTHKTDVCRKSLNPQWNSDWYRFEVDDEDLQDEPLQIRVLDHDTYSAHDAIGKVCIDLNPLLVKEHASVISGWFPIYDTMHGIRGELNVIVKVDLFSDFNKFRQSSCGVQFFCTSGIPHGYVMQVIYGFVEELVVNDDPEYQWIDKLRSQRASNEARQIHFTKLSGQLQRKIGLKVLEMGGNAVIGYRQCFDLEGESGVVVRGIGTSVMIAKTSGLITSPPSASPIKDSVFCPTTPPYSRTPSHPPRTSPVHRRNTVTAISPTAVSPSLTFSNHLHSSTPSLNRTDPVLGVTHATVGVINTVMGVAGANSGGTKPTVSFTTPKVGCPISKLVVSNPKVGVADQKVNGTSPMASGPKPALGSGSGTKGDPVTVMAGGISKMDKAKQKVGCSSSVVGGINPTAGVTNPLFGKTDSAVLRTNLTVVSTKPSMGVTNGDVSGTSPVAIPTNETVSLTRYSAGVTKSTAGVNNPSTGYGSVGVTYPAAGTTMSRSPRNLVHPLVTPSQTSVSAPSAQPRVSSSVSPSSSTGLSPLLMLAPTTEAPYTISLGPPTPIIEPPSPTFNSPSPALASPFSFPAVVNPQQGSASPVQGLTPGHPSKAPAPSDLPPPTAVVSSLPSGSPHTHSASASPQSAIAQPSTAYGHSLPSLAPPPPASSQTPLSAVQGTSRLLSPVHGLYGVGCSYPVPEDAVAPSSPTITPTKLSTSPAKIAVPLGRRSSESDIGTPPKVYLEVPSAEPARRRSDSELAEHQRGSSLTGSSGSGSGGGGTRAPFHRPPLQQQSIDMLEYPFFTMRSFAPGFLVHVGGVVAARSVKLLDRIHNPDEPETRDAWWTELRTEIRSHARALGCHAVIGYSEQTTICDEIIVLSAMGTAATVNLRADPETAMRTSLLTMSLDRQTFDREKDKEKKLHVDVNLANQAAAHRMSQLSDCDQGGMVPQCSLCHIPYNENSLPYPVNLSNCCICRRCKVPDMLFTTIEAPAEFPLVGKGCLLQARICRPKKEAKGEANAKEISDSLPFMEYELHCQLQNKLKVKGMNALFGLKVQVVVGERMLVALGTATAVYAAAMPPAPLPKVIGKIDTIRTEAGLADMRRRIVDVITRNKEIYHLYPPEYPQQSDHSPRGVLDGDSEDEQPDMELSAGNKDTFVLEIDDAEDAAVVQVLLDPPVPDGFDVCSTETMPGVTNTACNIQMFTRVWRGSLTQANNIAFTSIFDNILKSLFFKLRTMTPCCLCHLEFDVELHDEEDIQVSVTGICTGIGEPPSLTNGLVHIAPDAKQEILKQSSIHSSQADSEDMMFTMDGVEGSVSAPIQPSETYPYFTRPAPPRPPPNERRIRYYSGPRSKSGTVELTPLSYIPGGRIDSYLGHLNFFIIRETTSVRESGGLNGFMHSFVAEVMAICRAHVSSLSGNALVAFQLSECVLDDNLHKNQSQCLVNVCGDVVLVQYETDLAPLTSGSSSGGMQSISPLVQDARTARRGGTPRSSPRNSPKPDRARLIV